MDYIYVNSPVGFEEGETKLVTRRYLVLSEDETGCTAAFDAKNARIPRKRLADHKRYRTPVDGFYFLTERTALEHAVYMNNEFDYQLAGRLIYDLKPYVTDVALNKLVPGTCEEDYHLWGKTLKATVDELVRIFDKLNSLGFPPVEMTLQKLTIWLDILGYTEEDYPSVYTSPIALFNSDIQMLDSLVGSKEGLTTEQYDEKRRYVLRRIINAARPARERHEK